ncbi:hypothetical protein P12x_002123 [Tundrisphaera lichenicola]|uniref:hypothetical protein n=1 Tax=Tundrisphaera lichenicola TaxID=2029860 RepID=UPI003EBB05D2
MVRNIVCVIILAVGSSSSGADQVVLRESGKPGDATRSTIEMKAEGTFQPASSPGTAEPKPLTLKVETRLEFEERVATFDRSGEARVAVRQVLQAGATINGEVRPSSSALRPELSTLVASRREGSIVVVSAGGPLTRAELELLQGPGDPMALASLLPTRPVAVGDRWTVGDLAARNLSGYDALASNALEATLEALDEKSARVKLLGSIRGAALGGEGSMACDGAFTFDRQAQRVDRLTLRRAETRRPGPIEAGLDVRSTLTVGRTSTPPSKPLDDDAFLARVIEPQPGLDLLEFTAPDGQYSLLHDRDWHLYWDDTRQTILKRLDRGELVAQCNLSDGPNAGKGRHQDVGQFREDLRKALGDRFVKFVGQGEVDGNPAGGFRYKVSVQGRQGDAGVLWHYYLVAGPEGDQLIATFTLGLAQQAQFADQDLRLIGSLEWK